MAQQKFDLLMKQEKQEQKKLKKPTKNVNAGLKCLFNTIKQMLKSELETNLVINNLMIKAASNTTDLVTLQQSYFHLIPKHRELIDKCNLDQNPAQKRCNETYKKDKVTLKCVQIKFKQHFAPFVTIECPENYSRSGCCKCIRNCDASSSLKVEPNTKKSLKCEKKLIYESKTFTYDEYKKINDKKLLDLLEFNEIMKRYVEQCKEDFYRFGVSKCIPKCPAGWPDLGDYCQKNEKIDQIPFVWTIGDGIKQISSNIKPVKVIMI